MSHSKKTKPKTATPASPTHDTVLTRQREAAARALRKRRRQKSGQ